MDNSFILDIMNQIEKNKMMNVEQEINIYHLLNSVLLLNVPGDVVELGCHAGMTAAILQKTLDQANSKKILHVFDSFQGLPEKTENDGKRKTKNLAATKQKFIENFKKFNLKLPEMHEGWFKDTLKELPKQICFAHLDSDCYSSIKESLENVYPRLSKNAVAVVDDYHDEKIHPKIQQEFSKFIGHNGKIYDMFPGVKKACDEFFRDKKEKMFVLVAGYERHAYFRKE